MFKISTLRAVPRQGGTVGLRGCNSCPTNAGDGAEDHKSYNRPHAHLVSRGILRRSKPRTLNWTVSHAVERKNWSHAADFIGNDYQDQWGDDRARVLERAREFFRYLRGFRVNFSTATVNVDHRRATWIAKITIEGAEGEVMAEVKERVNSLATPFELEWRRVSAKPWDWKLVRVSNPDLEIPAGFE